MESLVVRRRVNTIAGHFAANDDISATATHIFPMNCSSIIRRCDNKIYFVRQASTCQSYFMRQGSTEQVSSDQSGAPPKCIGSLNQGSFIAFEAPLFARPYSMETNVPNVGIIQPGVQDCISPAPEPPKFARPSIGISEQKQFGSRKNINACESKDCISPALEPPKFARQSIGISEQKQFGSRKNINACESNGFGWSPRMDVAETGCNYVVTVELPGVGTNDIRVELHDKTLTVTGNRSTQWWRVASWSNNSISGYHKREILQGPYQAAWELPANVNKDSVSAEFVDGFLRISIPKL